MSFLSAAWRKLLMFNYEVEPALLEPYLPAFTVLDTWQGRHYLSLVGFIFDDVRLLGVPIPFHRRFEEVNLRFYVRHQDRKTGEWKRGVVFIKELVPKFFVTQVANLIYQEHYQTLPMRHHWDLSKADELGVDYEWQWEGRWHRMAARAASPALPLEEGSEAEFITEHYWGYTGLGSQKTSEYEVRHPRWEVYPVQSYKLDLSVSTLYGAHFQRVLEQEPLSVFLAEGSAITVEGKTVLRS
jgi:uncharacterized protein YqjF (DUF2071 family)